MIEKIKTIRAFTLIELLMVISIISLLSSVILGYVGSVKAKSRDTVRLKDMQQINTAANMYRDDKNEVPDSIETLVSTGYLSAVPKDPSTGIAYSSKSISTSKGKVFIASTTYETIKRDDGENQSVGVVVSSSNLTLADICLILVLSDSYPNCSGGIPKDQIIGMTGRSDNISSGTTSNISNCSINDINKECPDNILENCYCNGVINNINPDLLTQNECVSNGLFWDSDGIPNKCFSQNSCYSVGRTWSYNVCLFPVEWFDDISYIDWNDGTGRCQLKELRLPTASELLNALKGGISFNETYYWSQEQLMVATYEKDYAYTGYDPDAEYAVRCVRDK